MIDRLHPVHPIEHDSTSEMHVFGAEIDKDPSSVQAREHVSRSLVEDVEEISAKRYTALDREKPKLDKARKAERNLSYRAVRDGTQ